MNYVKDLQNLYKLMNICEELIIYPIGNEGNEFLELLKYTGFCHRVSCIATKENTFAQRFKNFMPIISLNYLPHFKKTAAFIVAAPQFYHASINNDLVNDGCESIVFMQDDTQTQIKKELTSIGNSGQKLGWFVDYATNKITEFEYRLEEQNEICALNTQTFSEYRNRFRGRKVVIVAGGPTVNYYEPIPDAIHIGTNFAWQREDITFDYLFTHDRACNDPNREVRIEEGFEKIRDTIFMSKRPYLDAWNWFDYPEDTAFVKGNVRRFYLSRNTTCQPIYQDICYHPLADFNSSLFATFQFALFTCPDEIYLVGCDTTNVGHFYDKPEEKNKTAGLFVGRIKVGYARMKMFGDQFYPSTKIISVNPVGLKGLFEDMYTDNYKEKMS